MAVLATTFFVVNANILIMPALLAFISPDLRLSEFTRGALVAALPLASFAGNVVFGPFIDAIGRRRSLLLGTAGMALLLGVTAVCRSGAEVFAARCATGLIMPLAGISVFPCIAEYLPPADRVAVTGYVMAGGSVTQVITTPLAVFAAAHLSWRLGFAGLAAVAAMSFVGALVLLPNTDRRRVRQVTRDVARQAAHVSWLRRLIPPPATNVRGSVVAFLVFVFSAFCVTALYPTWLISSTGRESNAVSLLLLVGGVFAVLGATGTGLLDRRLRPNRIALILAAPAAFVVVLPLFPHAYPVQLAAWALFAGTESLALPLLRGRTGLLVDEGEVSTINASLNAGYQMAAAAAGFVSAAVFGISSSFWLNSAVGAAGFVVAALTFALTAGRTQDHPSTGSGPSVRG